MKADALQALPTPDLAQYDAIIFDMDGTLVDSGQLHELAWMQTLEKYAIPIDRPLMRSLAGVPTKGTLVHLIAHFGCEQTAELTEMNAFKEAVVRQNFAQYLKPTALYRLAEENFGRKPMSVGTGAYTDEAEQIRDVCGVRKWVDPIVGAEQIPAPKPAPDTFLLCAKLMGVAPERCVVLEDSKLGLAAARAAGMDGIDVLEAFGIENDYFR